MVEDPHEASSLNERLLNALVYVPAGLVISVAEEFPRLASLGRQRLAGQVSSARAVGKLVVRTGRHELQRRSDGLLHRHPGATEPATGEHHGHPVSEVASVVEVDTVPPPGTPGEHVPQVSSLAIHGFDTLSASQVVQRLDGLSRAELIAVRTYEAGSRGRRTVLSRVDQLLDERA